MLASKLGVEWRSIRTYHELMSQQGLTPSKLYEEVQQHLHTEPYNKQEIMVSALVGFIRGCITVQGRPYLGPLGAVSNYLASLNLEPIRYRMAIRHSLQEGHYRCRKNCLNN